MAHFLLVTFPAQGHVNPSLQFAKRLIHLGAQVTFAITISAHRRMIKSPPPDGLSFVTFSDGYDDGFSLDDSQNHFDQFKCNGSNTLTHLIVSSANQGRPFTCLVYTLLLTWAADVARQLHLPSTLLWIQPAMVLDIYYYYFNGFADVIRNDNNDYPSSSITLPGLPLLTSHDLPSFLLASNTHTFPLPIFQAHFEALEKENNPRVLVNTFDAAEPEALKAIEKFNLVAVGPLLQSDKSFGGDVSKDYIEWLNSKPESSVIYVSFGSLAVLMKQQMEEIARGLLNCGRPFLWVIRAKEHGEEEKLSCKEELEQMGMVVPWCSQVEVLSHPSLGCFVTHCGWNSTLESLVSGVPMVAFPQWSDQGTNAKLIEDVWKTGVRMIVNKDGIVEDDEIKRCLELVVGDGERGEAIRRNAKKWKELAMEAANEGSSSYNNLKAFVDEIGEGNVVVVTHQSVGNSISIELPSNWCNCKWMGFAICASASASASKPIRIGIRARVIALGDTPQNNYVSKLLFGMMPCEDNIWLLYLSRDNWFATVGNGECSQIKVIFETDDSALHVWECGVNLLYEQDVDEFNQTNAQCLIEKLRRD